MKGIIRPTSRESKCPKCFKAFQHILKTGYICPDCQTVPKKLVIDVHWKGQRTRICSDKQGQPLDTYRRADDLLSNIKHEIDQHIFDPTRYLAAEGRKFYASPLLEEFLKDKLKSIAPSYRSGYKKQVERAKQHFGNLDVREIRKDDVVKYLEFLKKEQKAKDIPLKSKTILNNFANFKTFMIYLKEERQLISTVPDFPTEKEIERRMEEIILNEKPFHYSWFKPEDQMRILDAIEGNEDKEIIRFLMLHGCRPGEARALRVGDVNIATLSITIKSTYSRNTLRRRRKGKKSKPYSIAIHPEMIAFFKKRVKNHPEAFIFVNPKTGGPYMIDAFQNIFVSVRSKLNIPREVRLYDASRHSFVTQLIRVGLPVGEISKLVGHSSEKITENIYNHADDIEIENKRMAISKLSLKKAAEVVNMRAAKRKSSTNRQR
ncbi:MAG: tyrosine-type recombinase/integrase [Dissulfurispiraceae bacterium]